jgi:hypothetical protein
MAEADRAEAQIYQLRAVIRGIKASTGTPTPALVYPID